MVDGFEHLSCMDPTQEPGPEIQFGCNIVSLRVIMKRGFRWNPHKGVFTICRVEDHHNMFTVEYNEVDTTKRVYVAQTRRSLFKVESQTTASTSSKRTLATMIRRNSCTLL